MTTLTTEQQQRMEALNSAALLLVNRKVTPVGLFSKGTESSTADGLIGAAAETRDTSLMAATLAAIDLAEYVISGPEPEDREITIDEDGMRVTS